MKNLMRLGLRKYSPDEVRAEVDVAVNWIRSICNPTRIILIGSALGVQFDDCSDLDFVLIFPTSEEARRGRKKVYGAPRPFPRTVDCLCIDAAKYSELSAIGGVFWVAEQEGRLVQSA